MSNARQQPTPSPPQAHPAEAGAPRLLNASSVVEPPGAEVSHFPTISAGLHRADFYRAGEHALPLTGWAVIARERHVQRVLYGRPNPTGHQGPRPRAEVAATKSGSPLSLSEIEAWVKTAMANLEASMGPCVCAACGPALHPAEQRAPSKALLERATVGTLCAADCRCWHCEQESADRADSDAIDWLRLADPLADSL